MRSTSLVYTYIAIGTIGASIHDTSNGKLRTDHDAVASITNQSCRTSGPGRRYRPLSRPYTNFLATSHTQQDVTSSLVTAFEIVGKPCFHQGQKSIITDRMHSKITYITHCTQPDLLWLIHIANCFADCLALLRLHLHSMSVIKLSGMPDT